MCEREKGNVYEPKGAHEERRQYTLDTFYQHFSFGTKRKRTFFAVFILLKIEMYGLCHKRRYRALVTCSIFKSIQNTLDRKSVV